MATRPKKNSRAGNPLRVFPETLAEMRRLQALLRGRGLAILPAHLWRPDEEVTMPVIARIAVMLLAEKVLVADAKKRGSVEVPS